MPVYFCWGLGLLWTKWFLEQFLWLWRTSCVCTAVYTNRSDLRSSAIRTQTLHINNPLMRLESGLIALNSNLTQKTRTIGQGQRTCYGYNNSSRQYEKYWNVDYFWIFIKNTCTIENIPTQFVYFQNKRWMKHQDISVSMKSMAPLNLNP